MDLFNGYGDFDEIEEDVQVTIPICECCNVPLTPFNDTLYTCQECGKTERRMFDTNYYDSELNKCFNVNPHNNTPITIKGVSKLSAEQHSINKEIPNTNVIEKIAGIKHSIMLWNDTLEKSQSHIKIPLKVIDSVAEIYKGLYIKKRIKLRGNRVTALLVVLVHFEGIKQGTYIDKCELGKLIGVKLNNEITRATKDIYELYLHYDIPSDEDISKIQLNQYFIDLNIDKKYIEFVNEMMVVTSQSKLSCSGNYSRETTRYAALIYIIGLNTTPIPHKKICQICGVASTTFKGHISFLSRHTHRKEISDILSKYEITHGV
jgi:transcription initiation factor TFIIIB Brf1 subunit/transcription initiation factor TFIIB